MRRLVQLLLGGLVISAGTATALVLLAGPRPDDSPRAATIEARKDELRTQLRVTPAARRYSAGRYSAYFLGTGIYLGVLWLLLHTGLTAAVRDRLATRFRRPWQQALILYPAVHLFLWLVILPLSLATGWILPRLYGISTQTLPGYLRDAALSRSLGLVLGTGVALGVLVLIRRSPRRWWAWTWLCLVPLTVGGFYLQPLVIDPLYNRFTPLESGPLRDRLLRLAKQAGIGESRVFRVDASRRTRGVNAYVTGVGGSARIVLWDTLLDRLSDDEVLAVMSHEMGHYAEGHVPLLMAAGIGGSWLVLLLLDRSVRLLLRRRGAEWRVKGLDDPAVIPLVLFLITSLNFAGSPLSCSVSRYFEERADAFSFRTTGGGPVAASAFIKLGENNLSDPDPPAFIRFWLYTHPPLKERVERALQ